MPDHLRFVAIDILGPSTKKLPGIQNMVNMTAIRYTKLTCATPTAKIISQYLETVLLDNWILPYGIPNYVLTDNGPQFVSKYFMTLCLFLGFKKLTNTAYHRQTNGQVERYNSMLIARCVITFLNMRSIWRRTYSCSSMHIICRGITRRLRPPSM